MDVPMEGEGQGGPGQRTFPLKDLVAICQPRSMRITLDYKVRGGIHTSVAVEYPSGGAKNAKG